MKQIRQGTVGKPFRVDTKKYDLTGWSAVAIRFVEPDGVTLHDVTSPAVTVVGPATDGILAYTDATGLFPSASDVGVWKVIAIVNKAGVIDYSAPAGRFRCIATTA